ncbi:glycosyltransferase [Proteiniphilum saccharofermentans]|uniref:glycosyltransferase n=1 Tax=Proteiniphilum saccharofermentans TaxID=1642647 RepID=UPI0028AA0EB0|nr:glycosyltransferase [Proteiniphilum saccharofermentans]
MKKVCFFVTSLNSGGIENYLLRFLRHYEADIDATVYCKGDVFGELESQYRKLSNVRLIKSKIGYFNFKAYYELYHFLKKENFHSVCDFTGNFAGFILFIAYLAKIKTRIVFYRGSSNRYNVTFLRNFYNELVKIFVLKFATSILSNSKAAYDFFFSRIDKRFKVIYNGIDSKVFNINESKDQIRNDLGIPSASYVIGHTGRVHYSKNHEAIIKVANLLCNKYSDIHFVLCGKNTDIELVNSVDIAVKEQVHLLGYRSDIPRILKAFDIYFFPSVTEGQPNALIEAMIVGLPIVASDIEPIKETVPEELINSLIHPLNVDDFVKQLEEHYLSKNCSNSTHHKEWAIEHFNSDNQFKKFFNELVE